MIISERLFSGEVPKLAKRNLAGNYAVAAVDCELTSGELRPIRTNEILDPLPEGTISLYSFEDVFFPFPFDVDMHEHPGSANFSRLFYTGDGEPKQTDTSGTDAETYLMGVPVPESPPRVANTQSTAESTGDAYDSFYVTTYVNRFGEEGDKTDPSETIQRKDGDEVSLVDIGTLGATSLGKYGVVSVRIYRFARAGGLRFLAEVPIETTSYIDTVREDVVSASGLFATDDFAPPPPMGRGLHIMSNGIALLFVGRVVYVSEPYQPNAWRSDFTCNSEVVGISSFDNTAVILTDEYPELATIFDPRNINNAPLAEREPCVAKRSIVQGSRGVMYAAPSGLFYIGPGGARMLTQETHDYDDWQALKPETFTSAYRDGQYIAFYGTQGDGGGWIYDSREPNGVIRRLSQWSAATYVLDGTDQLCLVKPPSVEVLNKYTEQFSDYQAALELFKLDPTNPDPGNAPLKPTASLELYQGGNELVDKYYRSKVYGNGAPVAITSRRLLSEQFDENLSEQEIQDYEQLRSIMALSNNRILSVRSKLGVLYGVRGGAVGQNCFGSAGYYDLGGIVVPGASTFAGDALDRLPAAYSEVQHADTLCVYGDNELIHEEVITSNEPDRIAFTDRHRYWQFAIKGKSRIEQIDLASNITSMGGY